MIYLSVLPQSSVPKEARKQQMLQFLAETEMSLPPRAIYLNMESITFSEKTLKRHLREMLDDGYVEQIDEGDGYYRITETGREYLRNSS